MPIGTTPQAECFSTCDVRRVGGDPVFRGRLALIFRYPDPADATPGVPVLCVEVLGDGQSVTVDVCGEVDIATVELLEAGIQHGLREQPDQLSVSLSRVTFFSAAGLHALLAARAEANARAVEFVLRAPSSHVLAVLSLARVNSLFAIETEPPMETADAF